MGQVGPEADFDDWSLAGLTVRQPELRRTASVAFERDDVSLEYEFEALHEAFSYRQNPGGLPAWFAENRFEQAGRVRGVLCGAPAAGSSSTASRTATTRGARATGARRSTGSGCSRTRPPGAR